MSTVIPGKIQRIEDEDVDFRAPVSEAMLQKISGTINYALENFGSQSVGTAKLSMLNETQFQAQVGGDYWILADGRALPTGSEFETRTGLTEIPDMRGLFVRGSKGDAGNKRVFSPDIADTPLGTAQAAETSNHLHDTRYSGHNIHDVQDLPIHTEDNFTTVPGVELFGTYANPSITLTAIGTPEERPLCGTGNWFVKINPRATENKIKEEDIEFPRSVSSRLLQKMQAIVNTVADDPQVEVLGTIEISLLNETQFRETKGDDNIFDPAISEWALCDGRSLSGSAAESNTNMLYRFAPDMRGCMFRSLNNGLSLNTQEPPAGSLPGEINSGLVKAHGPHGVASFNNDGAARFKNQKAVGSNPPTVSRNAPNPTDPLSFHAASVTGAVPGGADPHPVNMTVNFYLKIN